MLKSALSDIVNWHGTQDRGAFFYKVSHPCLDGWSPTQTGGTGISWRVVRSLLTNCLAMLVLGTNWTTWYLYVCQQACKISHKMDSGMCLTISKADFLYSSHEWLSSILSCRKHGTALHTGFIPRLRLCWRPCCVYLEVEFLSQSVGCARNKLRFRTVLLDLKFFLCILDYVWMGYLLLIFGTLWLRFYIHPKTKLNPNIPACRKPMLLSPRPNMEREKQKVDQLSEVDHVPTNTHSSQGESQLYIFDDNEAVIKMIIQGRSPTMRHVSRTHRVALDWLFDRINLETKIHI